MLLGLVAGCRPDARGRVLLWDPRSGSWTDWTPDQPDLKATKYAYKLPSGAISRAQCVENEPPGALRAPPIHFHVCGRVSRDVAGRLVELALGELAGRAPDMAGPRVSNWTDRSGDT
jgi:hypothetical protein